MSGNVPSSVRQFAVPAVIVVVTLAVFAPVIGNGFVEWGDRGPRGATTHAGALGVRDPPRSAATHARAHGQRLAWRSLAADHGRWGRRPAGDHLPSLLRHAACAVVVYLIIGRLLGPTVVLAALFGALLFALHPLRVESVAWATERRGPLSSLMALLAVLRTCTGHAGGRWHSSDWGCSPRSS